MEPRVAMCRTFSDTCPVVDFCLIRYKQVEDLRFPRGRQLQRCTWKAIIWPIFPRKLHENERNGTKWGGGPLVLSWPSIDRKFNCAIIYRNSWKAIHNYQGKVFQIIFNNANSDRFVNILETFVAIFFSKHLFLTSSFVYTPKHVTPLPC